MPLLDIRNLSVSFATRGGAFKAVEGVDIAVEPNETLAIVGESGSGKSVAMLALMGLLPWTATVTADRMAFNGQDMRGLDAKRRRAVIGKDIDITNKHTAHPTRCVILGPVYGFAMSNQRASVSASLLFTQISATRAT